MRRGRLWLALAVVAVGLVTYLGSRSENPTTGEVQSIALSPEQEIVLGLQSAPHMAAEFGGLDPDSSVQSDIRELGERLVAASAARDTPYQYSFAVLADDQTVNAFALPGGPVFITRALLARLENEAQLAGILGHEIGHVVGRHAAEQIAKSQLAQSLVTAVGIAAADEDSSGRGAAQMAAMAAQVVQLKYGRDDELQSDELGVGIMADAGYDPRELAAVMAILARASGGGRRGPDFLASHPDPGDRAQRIAEAIARRFPQGVPAQLTTGRPVRLGG